MTGRPVIGIDLGGTNCRLALFQEAGLLGSIRQARTPRQTDGEHLLARLADLCRDLCAGQEPQQGVAAVGIGVPGVVAVDGTVVVAPNLPALDRFPLGPRLSQLLGLPVVVVNDANAAAWGEAVAGAGRQFASFLTLTLGTGVGGGLVLDRRLWLGAQGAAGEVGHVMVDPQGRPCGCGSRGCLETYASATGIVRTARDALGRGTKSQLSGTGERLTSQAVAAAALQGDAVALAAMALAGEKMGQVLAGVANLLNLEGVVITGGASAGLEMMLPALQRELAARAFPIATDGLILLRGELGEQAGILGAASLARQQGLAEAGDSHRLP